MTPTECVDLVEFIAGRCPAMKMQVNTPQTWYLDLVGYTLEDALEAARRTTLDKAFIGIGDLVRECDAIVRARAGRERIAALEAQLRAENDGPLPGDDPRELSGPPHPDVAGALVPLRRVPSFASKRPADLLRESFEAAKREAAGTAEEREAALAEAQAAYDAAVDEARAELEALRPTSDAS